MTKKYEKFQVDLLDSKDNEIATIGMVKSGVLDYSIFDVIRTGGNIEIATHKDATQVNWLNSRIRIYYIEDSEPIFTSETEFTQPEKTRRSLGIFITSTPVYEYSDTGITAKVELYDKLIIPSMDNHANTYSVPKGGKILEAAIVVLESCGVSRNDMLIDWSKASSTVSDALVWEAGTSKLQIINDLLDVIKYRSLWVDVNGKFRFTKWVKPSDRALEYVFKDDNSSIYLPNFTLEQDFYDIPNHLVAISKTSGEKPAYSYVAVNNSPTNPFSYVNRGRKIVRVDRNVDVTETAEGVEESESVRRARIMAELKVHAERELLEAITVSETVVIKHVLVPDLYLTDRVTFENQTNGIMEKSYTVTKMQINLSAGALVETTLREVLDVEEFDTVE